MKLLEWRERFLAQMSASGKDPEATRDLFGKPYVLKKTFRDIIVIIEGEALVTTKLLLKERCLAFRWYGYDYGCCASSEEPFAIPPLFYWRGVSLNRVEEFKGEIDWEAEIPELKLKID